MAALEAQLLALDQTRMAFKVKCPSCGGIHFGAFTTGSFDNLYTADRRCPKTDRVINIRVKDRKTKQLLAPLVSFPRLPKWDCKECYGSGEYTLFTHIHPCGSCFPII